MGLFSRSKVEPEPGLVAQVMELRSLVENLASEVRQLRLELAAQSDLVTKRMRRAVAAERAVERHQEQRAGDAGAAPVPQPATPGRPLSMWGARGRIARRRALEAAATNGTGAHEPAEAEE